MVLFSRTTNLTNALRIDGANKICYAPTKAKDTPCDGQDF